MKAIHAIRSARGLGLSALGLAGAALAQIENSPAPVHAEFHTVPAGVLAGQPATLIITVKDGKGNTVRDLQIVHERAMHLIVVSADLSEFAHLHPELEADGSFRVQHTFREGGAYLLFADFAASQAQPMIAKFNLVVNGERRTANPLTASQAALRTVVTDGMRVTLTAAGTLRAGRETMLDFNLSEADGRAPVTGLQPYLGELAHFIIIGQEGIDFLHAHAMQKGAMRPRHDHADHDDSSSPRGSSAAGITTVSAHTKFPRPGLYKIWAQFQRNGRVITAPFVVPVEN